MAGEDAYRFAAGAADRRGKGPMPPSGQPVVPRPENVRAYPAAPQRTVGPVPYNQPTVTPGGAKPLGFASKPKVGSIPSGQPTVTPGGSKPFDVGSRTAYPPSVMRRGAGPVVNPLGAEVGPAPRLPFERPVIARPTAGELGNRGFFGGLYDAIRNSLERPTNPPLSPASGYSQPGPSPAMSSPTPVPPGTRPMISGTPSVYSQPATSAPVASPPAPPVPATPVAAQAAPQAASHGWPAGYQNWGTIQQGPPPPTGQQTWDALMNPHGQGATTAAAQPTPQSFGQKLAGGLSNIRQAGIRGNLAAAGKGLARGTVLNPSWLASIGVNAAHGGAGVEGILRGHGGVSEGGVSIGQGMSNLAHAMPVLGGPVGTAYDWTLGPMFRAASNLGDLAGMGVAATFSDRARQDLSRAGSNLGQSLSDVWHGRSSSPQPEQRNGQNDQSAPPPDDQMKWLMSLPDKPGGPGEGPIMATAGFAPPASAQHQQATGTLSAQAPKTGGDANAVLHPGAPNTPPNPSLSGAFPGQADPMERMLADRFMATVGAPQDPFGVRNMMPGDVIEFRDPRAQVNEYIKDRRIREGQAYDMLMGYKQHQANMANAQANQELARSNSFGHMLSGQAAMMQAQAEMAKANPFSQLPGGQAGLMHALGQQNPGLQEAMEFPDSMALGGAELMRKPDLTADEAMAWDQQMHGAGHGDRHHRMLQSLLMRRLGAEGLDSSRTPGWFGMGGERASMVDQWLSQHLGLPRR